MRKNGVETEGTSGTGNTGNVWSQPPPIPPTPKGPAVSVAAASLLQLRKREDREPPPLLLNLQELERFENLLVFAKAVVEGYYTGKHKSPYRGSAAEFADYKEYTPGDEIARLDWRVYGRTRRLGICGSLLEGGDGQ